MPAVKPARFLKEIFRPGIYWKDGKRIVVNADDVARRRDSLKSLHAAGLRAPVIYEHVPADPNQIEGIPATPEELELSDVMKLTVGKSCGDDPRSCVINAEGGLDVVIEVSDPTAAAQLASGSIEHVSPELRPAWQNAKTGQTFREIISHIALTHLPIQLDQRPGFQQLSATPFGRLDSGILQLSRADLITGSKMATAATPIKTRKPGKLKKSDVLALQNYVMQLSFGDDDDGDDDKKNRPGGSNDAQAGENGGSAASGMPPIPQAPPSNPNMPKGADEEEQFIEALIAHAAKLGIVVPAGTNRENLAERLLTAFMTLNAANALNDAGDNDAGDDQRGGGNSQQAQEFSPMNSSQMSSGSGAPVDETTARNAIVSRIQNCKGLPPAMRDKLLIQVGSVQFSAGVEKKTPGSLSVGDVLAMYETQAVQFSAGSPQATLVDRIKALRGKSIAPGIADQLLAKVGTIQFSADGKEVAADGVSVVSLVEQYELLGTAAGALNVDHSQAYQLSGAIVSPEHPAGQTYVMGKPQAVVAGSPEAIKQVNGVLARTGGGTQINPDGSPIGAPIRRTGINATEAFGRV